MHGPPPTPEQVRANLRRYVRRQCVGGARYTDAVMAGARHYQVDPKVAIRLLGDPLEHWS